VYENMWSEDTGLSNVNELKRNQAFNIKVAEKALRRKKLF
jgi:hypothetical protein